MVRSRPALLEFEEVPAASSASVGSTPDAVSESGSAGLDESRSAAAAAAARQGKWAGCAPTPVSLMAPDGPRGPVVLSLHPPKPLHPS